MAVPTAACCVLSSTVAARVHLHIVGFVNSYPLRDRNMCKIRLCMFLTDGKDNMCCVVLVQPRVGQVRMKRSLGR